MKQFSIMLAAGTIAAGAWAQKAEAAQVYTTGFNAPTYTDAALVGQDGWAQVGTSATNPVQVTNTATNGVAALANTGQDVTHALSSSITSGSAYYGATINITAVAAAADYFMHLAESTTTTSVFVARLYAIAATGGYQLAIASSSGTPTVFGSTLPLGQPVRVVARYDFVPGGTTNDTVALYVNPVGTNEAANTPYGGATTSGTDAGALGIGAVNLRQGGGTSFVTASVDDLAVGTAFADAAAVAVPEPSSLALLPLAGLLAARRRRRQA